MNVRLDGVELQYPPRIRGSADYFFNGREWLVEQRWDIEGTLHTDGPAAHAALRDQLIERLRDLKKFEIIHDSTVLYSLDRDQGDTLRVDRIEIPTEGGNAAWATNLIYRFSVVGVKKPSDEDFVRREVRFTFEVDDLGYLRITETGTARYAEASYSPPPPLLSPSQRRFEQNRQTADWSADRRQCRYTYSWTERRLTLTELENYIKYIVGLRVSCSRSIKGFGVLQGNLAVSCRLRKGFEQRFSQLGADSSGQIKMLPDTRDSTSIRSQVWSQEVPAAVEKIAKEIVRLLLPSSSRVLSFSLRWEAESRALAVETSFLVLDSNIKYFELSYSASSSEQNLNVNEVVTMTTSILQYGGVRAQRFSEQISWKTDAFVKPIGPIQDARLVLLNRRVQTSLLTEGYQAPLYRISEQYEYIAPASNWPLRNPRLRQFEGLLKWTGLKQSLLQA